MSLRRRLFWPGAVVGALLAALSGILSCGGEGSAMDVTPASDVGLDAAPGDVGDERPSDPGDAAANDVAMDAGDRADDEPEPSDGGHNGDGAPDSDIDDALDTVDAAADVAADATAEDTSADVPERSSWP